MNEKTNDEKIDIEKVLHGVAGGEDRRRIDENDLGVPAERVKRFRQACAFHERRGLDAGPSGGDDLEPPLSGLWRRADGGDARAEGRHANRLQHVHELRIPRGQICDPRPVGKVKKATEHRPPEVEIDEHDVPARPRERDGEIRDGRRLALAWPSARHHERCARRAIEFGP